MATVKTLAGTTLWDRIAAWYHQSVFSELFRYLSENVFAVRLGSYENISMSESAEQTIRTLILSLMLGIILASAATVYAKTVPCGFLRRLLGMGASSPEKAVTLYESGYFRSLGVRADLKRGGMLAKFLCRADDDGRTLAGTIPEAEAAEDGQPSLVSRLTVSDKSTAVSEKPSDAPEEGSSEIAIADGAPGEPPEAETDSTPEPLRPVDFATDRFYIPEALRIRAELRCEKEGSGIPSFLLVSAIAVLSAILLCRFLPRLLGLADSILSLF